MSKLTQRPKDVVPAGRGARYERFNLRENPFPTEPVNKESSDPRINGSIFAMEIRNGEYAQIQSAFLTQPQSDLNRLRMGYICDTSYIGRGNGKSAFLVNLLHKINHEYCLDISDGINKCFGVYVSPEGGGRTKTFLSFVDLLFSCILRSGIIDAALATIRLNALADVDANAARQLEEADDDEAVRFLNSAEWFKGNGIDLRKLSSIIAANECLQHVPSTFPIIAGRDTFLPDFATQDTFRHYYVSNLKKPKDRLDFVFSHLVDFFRAATFNGAYIFVDDFERIPDFQSTRQKRDFAVELRSCLFDGVFSNARLGFYNMFLVLHAGVPQLIRDAWQTSGMENRYPITAKSGARHVIPFEKLNRQHALLLVQTYLKEYRVTGNTDDLSYPFTEAAIVRIGELCEYNAGRILRTCYDLLEKAADIDGMDVVVNDTFVQEAAKVLDLSREIDVKDVDEGEQTDLLRKAAQGE